MFQTEVKSIFWLGNDNNYESFSLDKKYFKGKKLIRYQAITFKRRNKCTQLAMSLEMSLLKSVFNLKTLHLYNSK